MLDIDLIFKRKQYFLYVTIFGVFVNVFFHYLSDVLHLPLFIDKAGILIAVFSFGPVTAVIVSVITALIIALTDPFYLFQIGIWVVLGILWGLGIHFSKIRHSNKIAIGFILLSAVLVYLLELSTFTAVMYYPFKDDVLPYVKTLNLFTLQAIDTIVSFVIGYFILYSFEVRQIYERKDLEMPLKGLFLIIIIVAASYLGFVSYSQDTALVPYLPKKEGWVFVNVRMDFVWAPIGVKGSNNYYYPEGRFNRSDPSYQVWFGLYWVQGHYGVYGDKYDQNEIFSFSILDQDTWLSLHGYKKPHTTVRSVDGVAWGTFKGYRALFMNGSYNSQSDVPPYEDVVLVGFFIVFYMPEFDRTVIIYACAVDKYYNTMEPILWEMAYSIVLP
ncbi:MAG: hypothetical protein ACP6IS_10160 [Candidatus Asgardarchaeia archaeon]